MASIKALLSVYLGHFNAIIKSRNCVKFRPSLTTIEGHFNSYLEHKYSTREKLFSHRIILS